MQPIVYTIRDVPDKLDAAIRKLSKETGKSLDQTVIDLWVSQTDKQSTDLSEKVTVHLDPDVKKYLLDRAMAEATSISSIINDRFSDMVENVQDVVVIVK